MDVLTGKAVVFEGDSGEIIKEVPVPESLKSTLVDTRKQLVEALAEVDDEIGELFLEEVEPSAEDLKKAIRRATIALKFVPVFMGSAYKNKGVQLLLDGVVDYLPNPSGASALPLVSHRCFSHAPLHAVARHRVATDTRRWSCRCAEVENFALDRDNNEEPVKLSSREDAPLVALAFKLEEGRFGQLTYMRLYQGIMRRGDVIHNTNRKSKIKVSRLLPWLYRSAADACRNRWHVAYDCCAACRFRDSCACIRTRWRRLTPHVLARLWPCSAWIATPVTRSTALVSTTA